MQVTIDKERLEQLIKAEIESVAQFGCCTGSSLIGVVCGTMQIKIVVTNDEHEFMDTEEYLSITDKDIVTCKQ